MCDHKKKISVCYVSFPLGVGGPQAWLIDVLNNIDQQKFEISVLFLGCSSDSNKEWLEKIEGKANIYHLGKCKNPVIRVLALINNLRKSHIDIIHTSVDLIDAEVVLASSLVGIPIRISHARNSNFNKIKKNVLLNHSYNLLRKFLINNLSTCLFAISKSAKDHHFGNNKKWNQSGYFVPTFVDVKCFLESINTNNINKMEKSLFKLCQIGRYCKQKNQIFSINLMPLLLERCNVHLYLIGNGRDQGYLEQRIAELGLKNNVSFIPPTNTIWEIMKSMDVCIFPSNWEGFGRVVVECQAMGIPVVCSTEIPLDAVVIDSLVSRIDLNESLENWCTAIVKAFNAEKPDKEFIINQFKTTNLNVLNGIKEMQKIYERLLETKI